MPDSYSGSLHSFRRADLLDIVHALDVNQLPPGYLTKYELQEIIRLELKQHRTKRHDPRFQGLWNHMPESKMDEHELDQVIHEHGATEDPLFVKGDNPFDDASPRKSLDQLYDPDHEHRREASTDSLGSNSSQAARDGPANNEPTPSSLREAILHPHILDTLLHSHPIEGAQEIAQDVLEVADQSLALVPHSNSLRRKASRNLSLVTKSSSQNLRMVAQGTVGAVAHAQHRLSHAWVVVVAIVVAELAWITCESIPWVEFSFGPLPSLFLPDVPQTLLSIPGVHLVVHPLFVFALVKWCILTLTVPFLLSLFLAFPRDADREHSHGHRHRHHRRHRLSSPSPLIFSLSRLSLALLRGYVLPATEGPLSTPPLHTMAQHATLSTLKTLRHLLQEASVAPGPGLSGWKELMFLRESTKGLIYAGIEGTVKNVWGVVAVGMGVAAVVSAVERKR
ncbi:hypothetical protein JCM10212_000170 [Sporobolomyces blumeae]